MKEQRVYSDEIKFQAVEMAMQPICCSGSSLKTPAASKATSSNKSGLAQLSLNQPIQCCNLSQALATITTF